MTNTKNQLPTVSLDTLTTVTGGLFGNDPGRGGLRQLFEKRDPAAVPSPLPNLREILAG